MDNPISLPFAKWSKESIQASLILVAPLCISAFVLGSLVWFGWLEWPGLHWDADLFASALINVSLHNQWSFDSYSPFLISKVSNAYNFHGVLQIWFFAKLLSVKDWQQLTISMAIVNCLTYLIWMWVFQRTLRRRSFSTPWLIASWLAVVPALVSLGLQGRPEQLALVLLALPAISIELNCPRVLTSIIAGMTLGALILLSPLVGIMTGFGYLVAIALDNSRLQIRKAQEATLVLGASLATAFVGIELISPFSLIPWLHNLSKGGTAVPFQWIIPNFETFKWGTTLLAPFWSIIVFSATLITIGKLIKYGHFLILPVVVAILIWISQRALDYSYTPFLPVLILLWIDHRLLAPKKQTLRGISLVILPQIYALSSTLILAQLFLFSFTVLSEGGTPAQARAALAPYVDQRDPGLMMNLATTLAQGRAGVVLSPTASSPTIGLPWAETSEYEPYPSWLLNKIEKKYDKNVEFFVLQQSEATIYSDPPQTIYLDQNKPFRLVKDNWRKSISFWQQRLVPFRLSNGYWLAIYERIKYLPK